MSLSIVLPPSTRVFVAAFTNAAYMQRVSITPPAGAGQPIVWQGTGEDNHPIGDQIVTTPAGSSNFTYLVSADYSTDGGTSWQWPCTRPRAPWPGVAHLPGCDAAARRTAESGSAGS